MSVFDQLLQDTQPGYEKPVAVIVERLRRRFGDEFDGVAKEGLAQPLMAAIAAGSAPAQLKLVYAKDIGQLAWWADLKLSDADEGQLAALIRQAIHEATADMPRACAPVDPAARWSHTILGGWVSHHLHSPTRGLFDYALALARDPRNRRIEVIHDGTFTPELEAYARERLGALHDRVRFVARSQTPTFLTDAIDAGPSTVHVWCEDVIDISTTLLAMFGPVVMFTCGDAAPTQYADAYWYAHDPAYVRDLWSRRGAPALYKANYIQTRAIPFNPVAPQRRRDRSALGFGPDDTVIVTVGNRVGVEIDQAFVEGMASLVLADPQLRWLIVGGLPDYFLSAFEQVLGPQFAHVAHDLDLAGLLAATDIYANPFRAGGGNTAIMAIEAGATVLTLDSGDIGAFAPAGHRAASTEDYFERLAALTTDPALRAAWSVEQQTLLATRLDQDLFAEELGRMCDVALVRYAKRAATPLDALLDQLPRPALRTGRGR